MIFCTFTKMRLDYTLELMTEKMYIILIHCNLHVDNAMTGLFIPCLY